MLKTICHDSIEYFINKKQNIIFDTIEKYGSPLNFSFPDIARETATRLLKTLGKYDPDHMALFGVKATKSQALLRAITSAGAGVDVSSFWELQDALVAGQEGERICASGPAKTAKFHHALISCKALIAIDSPEELQNLVSSGANFRCLLRYRPTFLANTRFGIDAADLMMCLKLCAANAQRIGFEGFAFHVSGYCVADRIAAFGELLPFLDSARELGLVPKTVDIGGGQPVQYVEAASYRAFVETHTPDDYARHRFPQRLYPYGGQSALADWVHAFFNGNASEAGPIAEYCRTRQIRIALEPGRSLVDQAGITAFRVIGSKTCSSGNVLFVEGSSFSACETWFNSEFLIEPIHLTRQKSCRPGRAYIAGQSCLDEDIISYRFIHFQALPVAGDILIYVNTAGYQSDLLENEFHRIPMPRRFSLRITDDHEASVYPDERPTS